MASTTSTSDSSHVPLAGDVVSCQVRPSEAGHFHSQSRLFYSEFQIDIAVKFTRRESEESSVFNASFLLPLHALSHQSGTRAAHNAVASMLASTHVLPLLGAAAAIDRILDCCRRAADAAGSPSCGWVLCVKVDLGVLVDQIPEVDRIEEDADSDYEYDEGIVEEEDRQGFVPASEESIGSLERVKVEESEKPLICCSVCLEDISVGSEATRLPCSHHFHGDCIVKWLKKSKFCPLCRFEMPS